MRRNEGYQPRDQIELAERVTTGAQVPLKERPTADSELEAAFIRAAFAWARWRERQRWGVC